MPADCLASCSNPRHVLTDYAQIPIDDTHFVRVPLLTSMRAVSVSGARGTVALEFYCDGDGAVDILSSHLETTLTAGSSFL